MLAFLLRRGLELVPLLAGLSLLTFLLAALSPGDYLSQLEANPHVSRSTVEALRLQYGLDQPLPIQFWRWIRSLGSGNLGYSFAEHRPVTELLKERVPNTLLLVFSAYLWAILLALPAALLAARRPGKGWDRLLSALVLVSLSVPALFSSLLALAWAAETGWLPTGGMHDPGNTSWGDLLQHVVLPAGILGLTVWALFTRHLRGALLDILNAPFIVAARARGLPEWQVLIHHGLRVALNPILSLAGNSLGILLSSSLLVEWIFGWPGMGTLMISSIHDKDLYVLMGVVLVSGILVLLGNWLSDVLLAWSDPRIRL